MKIVRSLASRSRLAVGRFGSPRVSWAWAPAAFSLLVTFSCATFASETHPDPGLPRIEQPSIHEGILELVDQGASTLSDYMTGARAAEARATARERGVRALQDNPHQRAAVVTVRSDRGASVGGVFQDMPHFRVDDAVVAGSMEGALGQRFGSNEPSLRSGGPGREADEYTYLSMTFLYTRGADGRIFQRQLSSQDIHEAQTSIFAQLLEGSTLRLEQMEQSVRNLQEKVAAARLREEGGSIGS